MFKYEVNEHYEKLVENLVKRGLFDSNEDFVNMAVGKSLTEYYGIQNMPMKKNPTPLKDKSQLEKDVPSVIECRVQKQGDGQPGYIRPSKDEKVSSILPYTHEDFKLKIGNNTYYSYVTKANAINVAYDEIYPKRMGPKGKNHLKTWLMKNDIRVGQYVYLIVQDIENKFFELVSEKPTFNHQLIVCR